MSPTPPPPSDATLARQKLIIKAVMILLLVMAFLVIRVLPNVPLPARIFVAVSDVIGAVILWVVLRQKFSGK